MAPDGGLARTPNRSTAPAAVSAESARRSAYIALIRRRVQPGSGSSVEFLRSRRPIPVPGLTEILAGHSFVVVGGVATALYMPARQTDDVDILVTATEYPGIEKALSSTGAQRVGSLALGGTLGIGGFAWRLADGSAANVLVSESAWARDAVQHPNYDPRRLPIVALPYLVLMKLDAGRGVDVGDLSRMLGQAEDDVLQGARAVVRDYLPDALADLESLIALGRLELHSSSEPTS